MARIRSTHPGKFTDEAFMALAVECPLAAILLEGVLCESDDHGIFEWKPLTLKARILPAIGESIDGLLERLVTHRFVMSFEINGRSYGAVRNFMRYQRPKKPKYTHPHTEEVLHWVGSGVPSTDEDGEAVGNQFPPGGEIHPQMEEGEKEEGGRKERTKAKALDADRVAQPGLLPDTPTPQPAPKPPADKGLFGKPLAYLVANSSKPEAECRTLIGRWRKDHGDRAVSDAVTRAQVEDVSDPVAFIIGCLNKKAREAEAPDRISYTNGSL